MSSTEGINEPPEMSPTPLTVAVLHGALMFFSFPLLCFVVPRFSGMFTALGASLPPSTLRAIAASQSVLRYWGLVIPGIGMLLWLDAKMYARLYRQRGRWAGLLWFWGWAVLLALAVPFVGLVLFSRSS